MTLWDSDDPARWNAAREAYATKLAAIGDAEVLTLEAWRSEALAATIATRTPPHATHEELVKLTRWKMKKGVWRQMNLDRVKSNAPAQVVALTTEAIAAIPDPRRPVALVAELDGVGPATASALLAVVRPDLYPFFDEEVATQIPGTVKVAFTIPAYVRYAAALRERARMLGEDWSADAVACALFAVVPST